MGGPQIVTISAEELASGHAGQCCLDGRSKVDTNHHAESRRGHIQGALNSMYKRFKGLTLLSEERIELVESKISSISYFGKATSMITAVDDKLDTAVSTALTLRRSAKQIVKKCKECRKKVSQAELQRLIQAIALETVMYVSENQTVRGGAESIRNAVEFWNSLPSVPQVKLSSFEYLESTANLTRLNPYGNYSLGVPDVVLDQVFAAMFGVRPTKQIFLRMCDGSTKLVGLRRTQTVGCLKIALEEQEGIPVVDQCLVHNGRELSNKKRLADECQVGDSSCLQVMLRVAGGMKIKVKASPTDDFLEIDVNPGDTVESMMRRLQQSSSAALEPGCQLELCLPEQPSPHEIISQLVSLINQQSAELWQTAQSWHAASCTVNDPNFGDMFGIDSCLQHYCNIAAALSDIAIVVNRTSTDSGQDRVKVWWTMSAVLSGSILGIPASHKRFTISGISTHIVRDGCIQSTDWSWDAVGFITQAGTLATAVPLDTHAPHDSDSEYNGSQSGSLGNGSPSSVPMAVPMENSLDAPADWFIKHEPEDIDIMQLLDSESLDFQLPPCHMQSVKMEHSSLPLVEHDVSGQQLAAWTDEAAKGLKREQPAHGDVVCLQYLEYQCGYCKVNKVSTSTGGDGRVRIRCECGGKHQDGQPRMHAKWKLCRHLTPELSNQSLNDDSSQLDSWNKRAKVAEMHFNS